MPTPFNVLDCSCNGDVDSFGQGGECTDGKNGRWCYVNEHACNNRKKYNRRFISTTPCKSERNPNKPCTCNGKKDLLGLGGSCESGGSFCYVDDDANCADSSPHNGKTASKNACKGKDKGSHPTKTNCAKGPQFYCPPTNENIKLG